MARTSETAAPVEGKEAQFRLPGVEREYCATSGTFANGQISCSNMAVSKIGPNIYVSEPKFYTGTFDLLALKVILGTSGHLVHLSQNGL